jgi:ClpP class serine protease
MAKYDYEMALNYARSKGKKIVGHIDGMACSAGYALMALCDEVYFTNPHDTVGCIGTMCAMLTNKDGDVNTVTQERYAEIYADGSPYKNKEYRDAAEGNYDGIKEELNRLCVDFQQMVRERRPRVTDDQMTGKTFDAGDVVGTMVDGHGDFKFCVNRVQQLAGVSQSQKGNSSGASREDSKPSGIKEEKQPGTQEQASVEQPASDKTESQTQKQATMAKSYPFIQSAAKVNSLVVEENGGFYMVETMADNVEEFVMKAKQTESTLAAKLTEVEQLNATIEQMKKDHAEALANLKAEHEKEVSSLKDAHKKESEHMTAKLNEAQKSIEQKDAEIKELSETAQLEPTPQDPPKDNNGGQESGQFHVQSVCGENMSWAEKAEARRKRDAEISKAR